VRDEIPPPLHLPGELEAMGRFWGDRSWHSAVFRPSAQTNLFGDEELDNTENRDLVNAYCQRLKEVAGFGFVAEPLSMRNSMNAVVYYLIDLRRPQQSGVEDCPGHLPQIRFCMNAQASFTLRSRKHPIPSHHALF
jgi:hypothetical protein